MKNAMWRKLKMRNEKVYDLIGQIINELERTRGIKFDVNINQEGHKIKSIYICKPLFSEDILK